MPCQIAASDDGVAGTQNDATKKKDLGLSEGKIT